MAKVTIFVLGAASVAMLCSCAAPRHGQDAGAAPVDGADREEYDLLERLGDHPLDLMTARLEELCSLPGFPERFAERLIDERRRHGTARRLFDALTPPEQETLRRYEPYIEIPGRLPVGLETRYTADLPGTVPGRRDDLRLACRSDRFRMNARYRSDGIQRLYLSGSSPAGHLRLHAGDLAPDLAMGLCFGSCATSYPFSSGYHMRGGRWISSGISLYGASIRGGAAEIWAGPVRLLLLGGRICTYADGRLDAAGPALRCARIALTRGGLSAGWAVNVDEGREETPLWSADIRWSGGPLEAAAEAACDGGAWSGLWALSVRGGRSGMSLLVYDLHPNWRRPSGRSFYGSGRRRRGCSIVLDRRLGRRVRVLSAFERSDAGDPFEERRRDLLRLECRWSAAPLVMKFSIRRRIESRSILMPSPRGGEQPPGEAADSIHLLQTWRLPASLRLRISCRGALERERRGYLVSPSIIMDRGFQISISWAVHRAIEGTPVIYCYERSLEGRYPWRALRGTGWRVALLAAVPIGPVRLSLFLGAQNGGLREGAAQAAVKF
ncbi:MAG TPA: hypothetical protein ENO08_07840 [Candidatus Eisenbacteria bacterium]|uniref:Helix-hairpin-helix domain-containing protein n=1 Tax=Eiseniibacteriota bacterium TaxID=2212470 RepID=A0A7V2AW81_UNCEI|nr:hypothetical protein [Candidatus Eisenbacteria bacterium]